MVSDVRDRIHPERGSAQCFHRCDHRPSRLRLACWTVSLCSRNEKIVVELKRRFCHWSFLTIWLVWKRCLQISSTIALRSANPAPAQTDKQKSLFPVAEFTLVIKGRLQTDSGLELCSWVTISQPMDGTGDLFQQDSLWLETSEWKWITISSKLNLNSETRKKKQEPLRFDGVSFWHNADVIDCFFLCGILCEKCDFLLQICCSLEDECDVSSNWFDARILFTGPVDVLVQSPCASNQEVAAIRCALKVFHPCFHWEQVTECQDISLNFCLEIDSERNSRLHVETEKEKGRTKQQRKLFGNKSVHTECKHLLGFAQKFVCVLYEWDQKASNCTLPLQGCSSLRKLSVF